MKPPRAASVVAHNRRTADRSSSGGGGGPRRRPDGFVRDPVEFTDVDDALALLPSFFNLLSDRDRSEEDFPDSSKLIDGRTNFFCLEAGRISSKSTGTPNDTKKSRRMRDLTQFGGCNGGGATSWDHKDRERSLVNMAEESEIDSRGGREERSFVCGKSVSKLSLVAFKNSEREEI